MPLDWLHPKSLRDAIWSDVEAQLIYYFQPRLNTDLKAADVSKRPVDVAVYNYSGTKSFDAEFIAAHRIFSEEEWNDVLLPGSA